jgi:hypothetical protein
MSFSVEQTIKPSALVGRAGAKRAVVDTTRKNVVETAPEHPTPQAKIALVNSKPDSRGLVAKVDFVV